MNGEDSRTGIEAVPFEPVHTSGQMVSNFNCGTEKWHSSIAKWLKAPGNSYSAIRDARDRGSLIWLYVLRSESVSELLGVGAIGPFDIKIEEGQEAEAVCCITNLAIDVRHQKKGYGKVILFDLLEKIEEKFPQKSIVIFVHEKNPARHWWEKHKFVYFGKSREYDMLVRAAKPL